MKIVIRAGGLGTRLWPYSRENYSKQFHAIIGSYTMLQEAVHRIKPLVEKEDLHVSTGENQVSLVRKQLPDLSGNCLIVEPARRNTGPAVGLECLLLEYRYPGCTIGSLGSDHHIGNPKEFRRLLKIAASALEDMPEVLFTIGVKPVRVETGYGYIQKGNILHTVQGESIFEVKQFTEKPNEEMARVYFKSGLHLWNSNMFVWKAKTILDLFKRFEPEMYAIFMRIRKALGTSEEVKTIAREYPRLKKISVDSAIIERAERVVTLEADIDWSDIGSWRALTEVLPSNSEGNLFTGNVLEIDTRNVAVFGSKEKLIALVEVKDLIVVDTPDALLICRQEVSQRVRQVVDCLKANEKTRRYI